MFNSKNRMKIYKIYILIVGNITFDRKRREYVKDIKLKTYIVIFHSSILFLIITNTDVKVKFFTIIIVFQQEVKM